MIEMVVFDMAGTVVDEDNLVYKMVQKAIEKEGYQVNLETVLTFAAGKEKRQAIADVIQFLNGNDQDQDQVKIDQIFSGFKNMLENAYNTEPVKPHKGAEQVFKALQIRGIKVVLNTGYDRKTADQLLKRLGWTNSPNIDLVVTASEVERGRPEPDMILLPMKTFNIEDPTLVAKIGDSVIDIEEGRNAGCQYNFGITTGAHTREQLERATPKAIIDSLEELLEYV